MIIDMVVVMWWCWCDAMWCYVGGSVVVLMVWCGVMKCDET